MTNSPAFRLIATDVDGTIVDSRKQVPAFTRHELQRVTRDYGLDLVLASMRMPASLRRVQKDLGIPGAIIAYNGALVLHPDDGPASFSDPLEDSTAAGLIEDFLSQPIHVGAFSHDRWFVSDMDYWALREVRGTGVWPNHMRLKTALENRSLFPVHKVMLRGQPEALATLVDSIASSFPEVTIGRDRQTIVELTRSSASKSEALKHLLSSTGIPPSSVLAFGDSHSDISMLKLAGTGIAVSNAADEVRAVACETTLSNDEDGVGYALRKYFPARDPWLSTSAE